MRYAPFIQCTQLSVLQISDVWHVCERHEMNNGIWPRGCACVGTVSVRSSTVCVCVCV
jgi:hypothetical protein